MTVSQAVELRPPASRLPITARPGLSIESHIDGDGVRMVVSGELDIATDGALREALAAATPRRVDLDLSAISFMGCTTLKVLVDAAMRRTERGESLSIGAASDVVRRLVDKAGIGHILGC